MTLNRGKWRNRKCQEQNRHIHDGGAGQGQRQTTCLIAEGVVDGLVCQSSLRCQPFRIDHHALTTAPVEHYLAEATNGWAEADTATAEAEVDSLPAAHSEGSGLRRAQRGNQVDSAMLRTTACPKLQDCTPTQHSEGHPLRFAVAAPRLVWMAGRSRIAVCRQSWEVWAGGARTAEVQVADALKLEEANYTEPPAHAEKESNNGILRRC